MKSTVHALTPISFHVIFFAVDQVKFGPQLRKVTEPYPDMVMHVFALEYISVSVHQS